MSSLVNELRTNASSVNSYTLRQAADRIEMLEMRVHDLEAALTKALPVVRLALYPKLAERITLLLGDGEQR